MGMMQGVINKRTVAALAAVFIATASARGEGKTVRVLTVGNSFANNALTFLGNLATAAGDTLVVGRANLGGCDLARHARHMHAYEADPKDPRWGRPYQGKSLRELLTSEPWDFVTIQQVSSKSYHPESFQPYADQLIATIREYAPTAEVLIHQTWAYRDDHGFWGSADLNTDTMYQRLRAAYDGLAEATGLRLIPSGDAMEAARQDPEWGTFIPDPDFDFATAKPPALPQERRALHSGYSWRERDGAPRLSRDGGHANAQGRYLLGCVWYEVLFGKSVLGNPFVTSRIEADEAPILQRIAHRVVSEGKRPAVAQP